MILERELEGCAVATERPVLVLPVPGEVAWPELGGPLRAELPAGAPADLGHARGRDIVVDADEVHLPLVVRSWRAGDVMRPLGMAGRRKLQDLFADLKVPRPARSGVPIVVDDTGEVVWVVGCALGERFKVTASTRNWLRLVWEGDLCPLPSALDEP